MQCTASCQPPLYSRLAGDPDLDDIIEMFVEEMPDRVRAVLAQLDACDWEGLRRTAHQLKGAAGSYGFDPISRSAGNVESAIQDDHAEEAVRAAVDELVRLCQSVTFRATH